MKGGGGEGRPAAADRRWMRGRYTHYAKKNTHPQKLTLAHPLSNIAVHAHPGQAEGGDAANAGGDDAGPQLDLLLHHLGENTFRCEVLHKLAELPLLDAVVVVCVRACSSAVGGGWGR